MSPELLNTNQLASLELALPEWKRDGAHIERWFDFKSFQLAIEFVRQVAAIAEEMNHHPDIDIRYRNVRIRLTTHSAGGLTNLDLEAAARIRALLPEQLPV